MKHYQRFLIGLYSLLMAALALLVAIIVLGWQLPLEIFNSILADQRQSWILVAVSLLVFLIAIKLFLDSFRWEQKVQGVVKTLPLGEVHITQNAIESMIKKAVQPIVGIGKIDSKIKCTPEGVALLLKVQMLPDINIPQITTEMQTAVKEYLEEHGGITLLEIQVLVEDATPSGKSRVS